MRLRSIFQICLLAASLYPADMPLSAQVCDIPVAGGCAADTACPYAIRGYEEYSCDDGSFYVIQLGCCVGNGFPPGPHRN